MKYTLYRPRRRLRWLGALAGLVALLALGYVGAAAVAHAEQPAPPAPAGPKQIAARVDIGGVPVGGLTAAEARAAVVASFEQPLKVGYFGTWRRRPDQLGATADYDTAVARALAARRGDTVVLPVSVRTRRLRAAVERLAAKRDRPARDAEAKLRGVRPVLTQSRRGYALVQKQLVHTLERRLVAGERGGFAAPYRIVEPVVTRADFGPVVVIHRSSNELHLYDGAHPWRVFGVATGQEQYPTPLGQFSIVTMQRNPWWYPPASEWARGLEPVPPGPGNPLGTRWMGLSVSGGGIHGTPDAASIGYSASHGCVRMRIPDAEWLFEHVEVGTPVFVVAA
jgi:hypothetical protein